MTSSAPYRISDREVPLIVAGYFTPTSAPHVPVLIGLPGTDDLFIVVFSTEKKLVEVMALLGIEYARVATVTHGRDLINSLREMNATGGRPYRIRLAVDPHRADNGRLRFTEALLSGDES